MIARTTNMGRSLTERSQSPKIAQRRRSKTSANNGGPRRSINVPETIDQAIQTGQQLLRERTLRELRYHPEFSGDVIVTLRIRGGVPFATLDAAEQSALVAPIEHQD